MSLESPFRPGFGQRPAVLAGRDELTASLQRRLRRAAPSHRAVLGPRGTGKTVLLAEIDRRLGDEADMVTVWLDCDRKQQTSEVLARRIVHEMRRNAPAWERFKHLLATRLNMSVNAVVSLSVSPRTDDGFGSELILSDTVEQFGRNLAEQNMRGVLFLDEIQALSDRPEMVRVGQGLQTINRLDLPVHSVHAGLFRPAAPQDGGGTFFERLDVEPLGLLDVAAARLALVEPLNTLGVSITTEALDILAPGGRGIPVFRAAIR